MEPTPLKVLYLVPPAPLVNSAPHPGFLKPIPVQLGFILLVSIKSVVLHVPQGINVVIQLSHNLKDAKKDNTPSVMPVPALNAQPATTAPKWILNPSSALKASTLQVVNQNVKTAWMVTHV